MFALLGANLALSEQISPAQLVGGALILVATIVAGGMTRCAAPSLAKEIYDDGQTVRRS
jgi:hypothetical protein